MDELNPGLKPIISHGVASRVLAGQDLSGDLYLVRFFPETAWVAAVDGLGHGEEAAAAAKIIVSVLETAPMAPLETLVRQCHQAALATRGAVMTLAAFDAARHTMTWLGVGNVEADLFRKNPDAEPARESVLLRGGVVGSHLPPLREANLPIEPGDVVVFATDGIHRRYMESVDLSQSAQEIADQILSGYASGTDDALVLVVRYVPARHTGGRT